MFFCVVNVNSAVLFKHFEYLQDLSFLASWALFILKLYKAFQTTLQIAMISKSMTVFRSKFQFQIPLRFYRTVEKVETSDGNDQKF